VNQVEKTGLFKKARPDGFFGFYCVLGFGFLQKLTETLAEKSIG